MKPDNVPLEFRGFDLYRYRAKSAWKAEREPAASECAESCWANMQTAAAELAKARQIYAQKPPGECQFALGEIARLSAEQKHWKGLMEYHRQRARIEAPDPRVGREPGEDDDR